MLTLIVAGILTAPPPQAPPVLEAPPQAPPVLADVTCCTDPCTPACGCPAGCPCGAPLSYPALRTAAAKGRVYAACGVTAPAGFRPADRIPGFKPGLYECFSQDGRPVLYPVTAGKVRTDAAAARETPPPVEVRPPLPFDWIPGSTRGTTVPGAAGPSTSGPAPYPAVTRTPVGRVVRSGGTNSNCST